MTMRAEDKIFWNDVVPEEIKQRFAEMCARFSWTSKNRIDGQKSIVVYSFQSGGATEAEETLARWEKQNSKKMLTPEQEWQQFLDELKLEFDVRAFRRVMAIAAKRLEGNEFAAKRPPVGVNFQDVQTYRHLAIKPDLNPSPTGWILGDCQVELRDFVLGSSGSLLKAILKPDGSIELKRWWKRKDKTKACVDELKRLLSMLAENPQSLMEGCDRCCICHKPLSDDLSRSRGIGPECSRFGEFLMLHFQNQSHPEEVTTQEVK